MFVILGLRALRKWPHAPHVYNLYNLFIITWTTEPSFVQLKPDDQTLFSRKCSVSKSGSLQFFWHTNVFNNGPDDSDVKETLKAQEHLW